MCRFFYLVPELCLPCGITEAMRQDFRVMKDVGEFTRLPPQRRQEAVLGFVRRILDVRQIFFHPCLVSLARFALCQLANLILILIHIHIPIPSRLPPPAPT